MSNNTINIPACRLKNVINNEEREKVRELISSLDEELTEVVPASYIEGGLGCPDCPVSFSLRNNLRAHLLRVHRKKVEHVDRFKGGRVAAFRRYHEKNYKPVERSNPLTLRQLAMADNYKKRKEKKLAGAMKAEVLSMAESYGEMTPSGLDLHLLATKANYAQEIKSKFLLVAGKCGIEDNYDNRRSIIIIILEWLHAAFPETIPAKYKNEVFDVLVNIDDTALNDNDHEEKEIRVEEEMREKLVAYLTIKVGQWEVRHVLMKHVLTLFHAQFAPFEYELERIKTMLQLEQLLSLVGDKPL